MKLYSCSSRRRFAIAVLAAVAWVSCGRRDSMVLGGLAPGVTQSLARSSSASSCVLDYIGTVGNPAAQKYVQVSGGGDASMRGWAIDELKKSPAGGVDLVIDQTPYSAAYGIQRPDVATHFNRPDYLRCGFELKIGPGQLSKGQHSVAIRVISSDKKSYYQGPVVQFAVN